MNESDCFFYRMPSSLYNFSTIEKSVVCWSSYRLVDEGSAAFSAVALHIECHSFAISIIAILMCEKRERNGSEAGTTRLEEEKFVVHWK